MKILQLRLDHIRLDSGCQFRATSDPDYVAQLEEAYRNQEDVPHPVVFWDGEHHWLADGRNRYDGAVAAGLKTLSFDVRDGTQRDAILWAFGPECPNSGPRGLRITREDKWVKVTRLLKDEEWGNQDNWSDREVARRCCVTHPFVALVRGELKAAKQDKPSGNVSRCASSSAKPGPARRKFVRGGKVHTQQVTARVDEIKRVNLAFDRCEGRCHENIAELTELRDTRSVKAGQRAVDAVERAIAAHQRWLEALAAGRERLTE